MSDRLQYVFLDEQLLIDLIKIFNQIKVIKINFHLTNFLNNRLLKI